MNEAPEETSKKQQGIDYVSFFLKCWGILVLLLFPYIVTDTNLSKVVEDSDYTTTFYASGKLALAARYSDIYPPLGADQLSGNPYDIEAHKILPNMSRSKTAICPYFPLAVLLFAPLTALPARYAFFAWQCLSVLALVLSALLIDKLRSEASKQVSGETLDQVGDNVDQPAVRALEVPDQSTSSEVSGTGSIKDTGKERDECNEKRQLPTFWLALLFMPVFHCLFIGQTALILGLLPSTAGFFLLRRNRPLLAGVLWSFTFLKPQFYLSCLFICIAMTFRKNFRPLLGLLLGALVLCAVSALSCGPESFKLWLNAMHIVDHVYSSAKNGVVMAIVASLPRMCILSSSQAAQPAVKIITYCVSCALAGFSLFVAHRRSASGSNDLDYKNQLLCLALCLVPLTAPYLFYYDLSVITLLWAAANNDHGNLRNLFVGCAVLSNFYAIMVVVPPLAELRDAMVAVADIFGDVPSCINRHLANQAR